MASLGEECLSSVVMMRPYCDYLGLARCSDKICPHARWRGGESAAALRVVFRAGEASIRGEVMPLASLQPDQALT